MRQHLVRGSNSSLQRKREEGDTVARIHYARECDKPVGTSLSSTDRPPRNHRTLFRIASGHSGRTKA